MAAPPVEPVQITAHKRIYRLRDLEQLGGVAECIEIRRTKAGKPYYFVRVKSGRRLAASRRLISSATRKYGIGHKNTSSIQAAPYLLRGPSRLGNS